MKWHPIAAALAALALGNVAAAADCEPVPANFGPAAAELGLGFDQHQAIGGKDHRVAA